MTTEALKSKILAIWTDFSSGSIRDSSRFHQMKCCSAKRTAPIN